MSLLSETTVDVSLGEIRPMKDHPFYVRDDEDMARLVESINKNGLLNPIIVRRKPGEDTFEIVSGHRRYAACHKLGMKFLPAFVRDLTDEEAILTMVDSNLHREHILPSEKAFAYKMKMDVLRRQGERTDLLSCQADKGLRSDEKIAEGTEDSARQVQRYIRLTYLNRGILDLVDSGRIALSPAVELSYLPDTVQRSLLDFIRTYECTPSYSQAVRLRKAAQNGQLDEDSLYAIMSEEKGNQREVIRIPYDKLSRYFPRDYLPGEIADAIVQILEERKQRTASAPTRQSVQGRMAEIKAARSSGNLIPHKEKDKER